MIHLLCIQLVFNKQQNRTQHAILKIQPDYDSKDVVLHKRQWLMTTSLLFHRLHQAEWTLWQSQNWQTTS